MHGDRQVSTKELARLLGVKIRHPLCAADGRPPFGLPGRRHLPLRHPPGHAGLHGAEHPRAAADLHQRRQTRIPAGDGPPSSSSGCCSRSWCGWPWPRGRVSVLSADLPRGGDGPALRPRAGHHRRRRHGGRFGAPRLSRRPTGSGTPTRCIAASASTSSAPPTPPTSSATRPSAGASTATAPTSTGQTVPHRGFELLREWAERFDLDTFVVTSNVDGQFQKAGFGEDQVLEVHGSIHHLQCLIPCSEAIWDNQRRDPGRLRHHARRHIPRLPPLRRHGPAQHPHVRRLLLAPRAAATARRCASTCSANSTGRTAGGRRTGRRHRHPDHPPSQRTARRAAPEPR